MLQSVKSPVRKRKNSKQALKKLPMFDVLDKLRRENKLIDNSITFHYHDGTSMVQSINKEFVIDDKNRKRSTEVILMDINALVHDNGASHFSID